MCSPGVMRFMLLGGNLLHTYIRRSNRWKISFVHSKWNLFCSGWPMMKSLVNTVNTSPTFMSMWVQGYDTLSRHVLLNPGRRKNYGVIILNQIFGFRVVLLTWAVEHCNCTVTMSIVQLASIYNGTYMVIIFIVMVTVVDILVVAMVTVTGILLPY